MATHSSIIIIIIVIIIIIIIYSSILAWEIPWTEEPGRLQTMGSQKRHDLVTKTRERERDLLIKALSLREVRSLVIAWPSFVPSNAF